MNVNHIFIFTICVMLPNRLYSQRKDRYFDRKNRYFEKRVTLWTNLDEEDTPFLTDDDRSILIKVLARHDNRRVYGITLVSEGCRIELKLVTQSSINEACIVYMAKILGIPSNCIEVAKGFDNNKKTLRVYPGFITIEEIKKKIARHLADTLTH